MFVIIHFFYNICISLSNVKSNYYFLVKLKERQGNKKSAKRNEIKKIKNSNSSIKSGIKRLAYKGRVQRISISVSGEARGFADYFFERFCKGRRHICEQAKKMIIAAVDFLCILSRVVKEPFMYVDFDLPSISFHLFFFILTFWEFEHSFIFLFLSF